MAGGGDDSEPPFFSVEVVGPAGVEVVNLVAVADGNALPDDMLGLKKKVETHLMDLFLIFIHW